MTNVHIKAAHRGQAINRYHTEDCRHYPDNPRQITLKEAKERGFTECRFCSGEYEPAADDDPMRYINAVMEND